MTGPILVVGGRHRKGSAIPAVPHLAPLQPPIDQWVLTGLPGSTLLALGVLQEGPTFTALSVFLSRGTEGSNPAATVADPRIPAALVTPFPPRILSKSGTP